MKNQAVLKRRHQSTGSVVIAAVATFVGLAAVGPAFSASNVSFLPHRAVYDLTLKEASDRSGIDAMTGRIVYELTGSACEGYAARYRYSTRIHMNGKVLDNDQRSTVFESADGKRFDFITHYFLNGQQEQDLRGSAMRGDGGITVELSKPDAREVKLDPAIYMNQHLIKIVEAARAGETFLTKKVFDGSDNGDQLVDTNAVIGKAKNNVGQRTGETAEVVKEFAERSAWPVSVSYFKTGKLVGGGERLPSYQVSFLLYEDGVSRDLIMRYEDYSLRAALTNIEYLKKVPCK